MKDWEKRRDDLCKEYIYFHCRDVDGRDIKMNCFKAGYDAARADERELAKELVEFIEYIAPSWLPEGARNQRRELLANHKIGDE